MAFHLLESDKALLHFSSIYLWQTVWVKGFIHHAVRFPIRWTVTDPGAFAFRRRAR